MKRIVLSLVIVLATLGFALVAGAQDENMTAAHIEQIVTELWNAGDDSAIADLIAEDVVVNLPPSLNVNPPFSGHEGYLMNVMGWRAGLPDLKIEVLHLIASDELAAARVMITGTQTETFFGIPATNAELAFAANILYELDDEGKVVAEWWEWDTTLELIQLGLFTPPAPPQ
ncbi:MAG: ester cyclase [Anaerolineae bacterium]|nr:ester cyclase [Anaerolineae bacterium]